ncbi:MULTISPECIES: TonB-dependent receptor domain-containing protein [Vibrio]|uniref:TonB-dependent receptor domain-containing protein n=1 Tax=Vibrio TaxID=662 RepID=UPI0001B9185E|nr:TonB-dependent receptor [Vibrio furnissii]EEX42699.1 outer membrane vitamin B12 receptor BtuB [Vibrio furnissii CIP 102972]MCG6229615.1 TonB-dependent receptor [Vibrio furnissii]QDC91594.1 TonB-dependent receptor [Vibrio furnissii]TRN20629.1 TonB-dependent receptor [Vibrio furnissii]UON47035.1 TonB-dependent receptor [Vibrio furnissii]
MNKSLLAVAVASLLPYASFSFAQDTSADETVVVTANRFEQKQTSVLSATTVISRQEIEQYQANSLTEVLRRVPGVEIAQNGGRGHSASVFMRGTNSSHVLVLVDGVRIDSAAGGVAINRFPLGLVERLEVIRGPGAAMYGSDAVGGVINIITRSHRGNNLKQVTVGIGSHQARKGDVVAKADVNEQGHLQLAAGFEKTDGYDIKSTQTGVDYGYESQNLMGGYEHRFNDRWVGYVSASWFDSDVEYNSSGSVYHGYSDNQSFTGQLNYEGTKLKSLVTLNYQQTENLDYSQSEGKDNASTRANIDLTQIQWANLYQLNDYIQLGGGIDARRESLDDDALNYGSAHALAGESRDTKGAFGSGKFTISDWVLEANVRHDKHDKYDGHTTWSVAAGYQLGEYHRVRASYGTAYKAPSYTDLTTTPDLEAEESRNMEVGVSGAYSFARWNISAYDNKVDNLIIWYESTSGSWYSDNVDARIKGLEMDVNFDTGPINHTLVAEFKDHKDDNGVQLARRAKENYKWIASAQFGDVEVNTTYTYTGKRLNLPKTETTGDDYIGGTNLWDASVGYWVSDTFVVRTRVENLFNEQYETAVGYRSPERAYYLNATYQF